TSATKELRARAQAAQDAARPLANLPPEIKNRALAKVAEFLHTRQAEIIAANRLDYQAAEAAGMGAAMLDRLMLDAARLEGMAKDVMTVAALPDPVGEVFDMRTLPNGLLVGRKRVPLGVVAAIYESRPNVTVDIFSLCLKSGNAVILRGGKEALNSNSALVRLVRAACESAGVPRDAVQFVENTDHALVSEMVHLNGLIDLVIPRGGAGLIRFVSENATVPVVTGGIGVCHLYVDRAADTEKATAIAYNAKVQRPTVCNALDCVLAHKDSAPRCLPEIAAAWARAGVEIHADERALAILEGNPALKLVPAAPEDWGKEFLALVASVKVVDSLDEALGHIARYGSGHSEAIVTEEYGSAMRFLNEVDAACVYVNASTRFTDGSQLGLGAEVGISTQKMHARGPMGLKELTAYKWIIFGNGQVRA
ncbi:MAG: glutamate-5-semialdehyde dehydrogenase, partial [Chloroflexi bacterium]|nr:glutamate-5-semialdehyde dehydrogenase [Chloroflexota bacterium]